VLFANVVVPLNETVEPAAAVVVDPLASVTADPLCA
jgi:hypothetical protein